MPTASPLYAGLLALVFLLLSFRVVQARRRYRVSVGDGGQPEVIKAMRAQANCAEYAPIGLILLLMVELQGAPVVVVHALGLMLLAGRCFHGYGFGSAPQIVPLRIWGMYLTIGAITSAALANIGMALL